MALSTEELSPGGAFAPSEGVDLRVTKLERTSYGSPRQERVSTPRGAAGSPALLKAGSGAGRPQAGPRLLPIPAATEACGGGRVCPGRLGL